MDQVELRRWAGALRALAGPVVAGDDVGRAFVDEMGHRRPVDGAFLGWCGRASGAAREGAGAPERGAAHADLDVVLWEHVRRAGGERGHARRFLRGFALDADGSLTDVHDFKGIEVWTETELSALHALSWLALLAGSDAAWDRVMRAARWHVTNTQPDNATGHPWALHVFLWLERASPGMGGLAYAETLLHNCQVGLGRVDLFGAYVLLDCARAIEEWAWDAPAREAPEQQG